MIRGLAGVIIWTDDPGQDGRLLPGHAWTDVSLGAFALRIVQVGRRPAGNREPFRRQGKSSSDPYRVMVNLDVEDIHASVRTAIERQGRVHSPAGARALGRVGVHLHRPGREYFATAGAAEGRLACLVPGGFQHVGGCIEDHVVNGYVDHGVADHLLSGCVDGVTDGLLEFQDLGVFALARAVRSDWAMSCAPELK